VGGSSLSLQLVGGASITATDSTFASGGRLGLLFSWGVQNTPSYIADNFNACTGPTGALAGPPPNCGQVQ